MHNTWETTEDNDNVYTIEKKVLYRHIKGFSAEKSGNQWHIIEWIGDERGPIDAKDITQRYTKLGKQQIQNKRKAKEIIKQLKDEYDGHMTMRKDLYEY